MTISLGRLCGKLMCQIFNDDVSLCSHTTLYEFSGVTVVDTLSMAYFSVPRDWWFESIKTLSSLKGEPSMSR